VKTIITGFIFVVTFYCFQFNSSVLTVLNIAFLIYLVIKRKEVNSIRSSYLLIAPIITAAFGFFFYPTYDVLKDVFYLLNPFLLLTIGYLVAERVGFSTLMRIFVYAGVIFSTIYILTAVATLGTSIFSNLLLVRNTVGSGNGIPVISLGLLLFLKAPKFNFSPVLKYLFILLNFSALVLFSSRTYWIFTMILIVFHYWFNLNTNKRVGVFFLVLVVLLPLGVYLLQSNSDIPFIKKFQNSLVEMKGGNYSDAEDINTKYRGFETYRALETYLNGNLLNYFFGHGLGKMVDLKSEVKLGEERRFIPVLHNGFMYILVKTGVIGLCFYILFYFKIIIRFFKKEGHKIYKFLFSNMVACIGFLFFSNFVIYAFFNLETELVYIYFGALIYYLMLLKQPRIVAIAEQQETFQSNQAEA
jgi:hypothetical protein